MTPRTYPPAERFWPKVDKSGECWLWLGYVADSGYAFFRGGDGRTVLAHRWAYEALVGPIPANHHLDHLCHTADATCPGGSTCLHRRCVNPSHCEPVSPSENTLRAIERRNGGRDLCSRGHPLVDSNVVLTKSRGTVFRQCRECKRMNLRAWRATHSA